MYIRSSNNELSMIYVSDVVHYSFTITVHNYFPFCVSSDDNTSYWIYPCSSWANTQRQDSKIERINKKAIHMFKL